MNLNQFKPLKVVGKVGVPLKSFSRCIAFYLFYCGHPVNPGGENKAQAVPNLNNEPPAPNLTGHEHHHTDVVHHTEEDFDGVRHTRHTTDDRIEHTLRLLPLLTQTGKKHIYLLFTRLGK